MLPESVEKTETVGIDHGNAIIRRLERLSVTLPEMRARAAAVWSSSHYASTRASSSRAAPDVVPGLPARA